MDTDGRAMPDFLTRTSFELPVFPKRFLARRINEYVPSASSTDAASLIVALFVVVADVSRAATASREAEVTFVVLTSIHVYVMGRPPDPDELEPSNTRSSHIPREEAPLTSTCGCGGLSGELIVTVVAGVASSAEAVDFNRLPRNVKVLPGTTLAPCPNTNRIDVDPVSHVHVGDTP